MTPILPRAAKLFNQGDFKKALALYQSCLTTLRAHASPPRSLIAFCESRINECRIEVEMARARSGPNDMDDHEVVFEPPDAAGKLPCVSIIIPHYNSGGLIYQALDSIASQSMQDIETIIIDDGSDDGSLLPENLFGYPAWMRLRMVQMGRNGGPARCRNLGITLAQGRGICLLDADDCLDSTSLESRWRVVDGDTSIAGAFSTMTYMDFKRQALGSVILGNAESFAYTDFISNKFPCSALLFRRRALLLDKFDESLICGEDYECFSRIAQRGGLYKFAPGGTILYRQHGESLTHKDALLDLQQRVDVTRKVHARQLPWSAVSYTKNLPEAIIVKESSLRGFPVACIYAMRHEPDKAFEIGYRLDADAVASHPPKQVADSIRFFLTREEFQPSSEVPRLLESADKACLLQFFNTFFRVRHRSFVVHLLSSLLGKLPAETNTALPDVLGAPLIRIDWEGFLNAPESEWNGYLLLHRKEDVLSDTAEQISRSFLQQRGDLDGLFVYRTKLVGATTQVDISSIAPADPDSIQFDALGQRLNPAVILHELPARALRAWLLTTNPRKFTTIGSTPEHVEKAALMAIHSLRLKMVGGIAGLNVQDSKGGE